MSTQEEPTSMIVYHVTMLKNAGPWSSYLLIVLVLALLPRMSFAGTVTFSWDANPEEDLAGYRLYYDVDAGDPYEGDFILQGESPLEYLLEDLDDPANPQITIVGVPSCMHVFFAVTAFDTSDQESGYSDEVDATIGTTPEEVAVVPGGVEGELFVAWAGIPEDDTGSIETYRVHYGFEPGEPYDGTGAVEGDSPIDVESDSTSLSLTGLTPGVTVYVRVDSVCADETIKSADEVSGTVAVPECGNEALETGETCDPPESCPLSCDDENSCTADVLVGSAESCDSLCRFDEIEACTHGDGCCPAGCVHDTDDDCSRTCGDGTIDEDETCDPPNTCPVSCEDTDPCISSILTGSAENCNAACSTSPVSDCIDSDGCCPSSCTSIDDSDCSQSCGNGAIEAGELCDPPATCPSTCETTDACSVGAMNGHPSNCNSECSYSTIVACTPGDGCCPSGCTTERDSDCGGGITDGGPTDGGPTDGGPTDDEPTDQGGCACRASQRTPTTSLGGLVVFLLLVGLMYRRSSIVMR